MLVRVFGILEIYVSTSDSHSPEHKLRTPAVPERCIGNGNFQMNSEVLFHNKEASTLVKTSAELLYCVILVGVSSLLPRRPEDQSQVVGLGGKHTYAWGYLTDTLCLNFKCILHILYFLIFCDEFGR